MIMKQNLLLAVLLAAVLSAAAQKDSIATNNSTSPRLATISTMDGAKFKGWFYKIDDNKIYLLPAGQSAKQAMSNPGITNDNGHYNIDALQINTISLKKKNAGLRGALIGFGVGAAAGVIAGFASGDDDPTNDWFALTAGEKAVVFGALGGVTGALIGGIAGALAKKFFVIGGKKDLYRNERAELNKLAMVKF